MTLTIKLKLDDDIRRVRLGSSDPHANNPNYSDLVGVSKQLFGISEPNIKLKYLSASDHLVPMKSDLQLDEAIAAAATRDRVPQFVVTGTNTHAPAITSAPSSPNLNSSSYSPSPLSASAPTSPSFALKVPTLPSSVPSKFETTPKSSTPPPTLTKRFHDLVKYVNIPDVLHGLENFGHLSSDQSIELFECIMQLRNDFPELSKVLQYEEYERPICTVKHIGVTCDSCLTTDICGTRYKCAICPDFDMCEKCERKGLLTHEIATECPFVSIAKPPTSPPITVGTPTYKKRQLQFTTLLKKKQLRENMRKMHIQEVERVRQETMRAEQQKREAEARAREEEKQRKETERQEKEKQQRQQQSQNKQSGGIQPAGKSILWGYFENLKKQNKLQIVDTSVAITDPTPPIAISGNLDASTSSVTSTTPASLASSTSSTAPLSPPFIHISSSSSSSSSSLSSSSAPSSSSPSPVSSRASLGVPSSRASPLSSGGMISSRLKHETNFTPKSPECSPLFPSPTLKESVGSPVPKRASSLKHSTTIQREQQDDELGYDAEYEITPTKEESKQKRFLSEDDLFEATVECVKQKQEAEDLITKIKKEAEEAASNSRRDLSEVLCEMGMGLRFSDSETDSDELSDSGFETSSPAKKTFFSSFSLRDLLK